MSLRNSILIIAVILLIDQFSKIYIKTNFILGEEVPVFDWFKIYFIENDGMAWGTKIPGTHGKLFLTIFRLLAITGIGYWLYDSSTKHSSRYLMVAISLIFAGAVGNIIDSVFYGQLFSDSHHQLAEMFTDKPYQKWFHGEVVDMLYFPIVEGHFPDWLPIWGGQPFKFFNAIFNVADVAISTGVGILIVFNKKAFAKKTAIESYKES
ncbi:lipoprotein signal peptidase [Flavobacterium sp. J49]|uniref:lipoprotein signal peptidase n=1 Tax=Flavobacterium sp. J49 TaxID=2718534 RepID=UPI0015932A82|nr:lipoprotein signal peptidase [Flavobacterium sp. J49]MBF6641289.1 lipoprotein signal peptidase [Flavobacterium sp. J49]NIC02536.1 lipoprotein signal peptidase [Flavobacterium sp. J49]